MRTVCVRVCARKCVCVFSVAVRRKLQQGRQPFRYKRAVYKQKNALTTLSLNVREFNN